MADEPDDAPAQPVFTPPVQTPPLVILQKGGEDVAPSATE